MAVFTGILCLCTERAAIGVDESFPLQVHSTSKMRDVNGNRPDDRNKSGLFPFAYLMSLVSKGLVQRTTSWKSNALSQDHSKTLSARN